MFKYCKFISRYIFPLLFSSNILILLILPAVSAIRKDVGLQEKLSCRITVPGRYLLSDDNGHVCDALSLDPLSRCCPLKGEQFSLDAISFQSVANPTNIVFHAA